MSGAQKAAAVLLPLFSAGILVGVVVGRSTSIDYAKRSSAERFIALYSKWKRIDTAHGQLTLRVGNRVYTFTTGDAQVSKKYLSAIDIASNPAPKVDFEKDIDKLATLALAPPAATGILVTVVQAASSEPEALLFKGGRGAIGFVLVGVTLGGAAMGYYMGHRSAPDYETRFFRPPLKTRSCGEGLKETSGGFTCRRLSEDSRPTESGGMTVVGLKRLFKESSRCTPKSRVSWILKFSLD